MNQKPESAAISPVLVSVAAKTVLPSKGRTRATADLSEPRKVDAATSRPERKRQWK